MSSSAFVLDWSRPVPLEEFFLPLTETSLPAYRACTRMPELQNKRWRIVAQGNATANEQWFSSARSGCTLNSNACGGHAWGSAQIACHNARLRSSP